MKLCNPLLVMLTGLLIPLFPQAQTLSVTYRFDLSVANLLNAALKTDTFSTVGTQTSFYRLNVAHNQSVYFLLEEPIDTTQKGNSLKNTGSPVVLYKDFDGMVMYKQSVSSPNIVSQEPMQFDSWNLRHEEVREILGYRCKKATRTDASGDDLVAWYAPDIPVSDGPLSNYGLPGLVLVVGSRFYSITAIDVVSPGDAERISLPKADAYVTPAEFIRLTRPKPPKRD